MIVGLFLRNFKTYQGINFIPISNGEPFNGLIGDNGVGKSSTLEALNSFFNNNQWIYHISHKRHSLNTIRPHIVPLFLIKKSKVPENMREIFQCISDIIQLNDSKIYGSSKPQYQVLMNAISEIVSRVDINDYYFLAIGQEFDGEPHFSIFHHEYFFKKVFNQKQVNEEIAKQLLEFVKSKYDYLYIPKELEADEFVRLENKEIHTLMGETLNDLIGQHITKQQVDEINKKLNEITDSLSSELGDFKYKSPNNRQKRLQVSELNALIVEAYFKIRVLHKKFKDEWLELKYMSSGEKQLAILEIASKLIASHRKSNKEIIFAIDEPESSLHISKCYLQFEKIHNLSRNCCQVIFASHWYGFIPTSDFGSVVCISNKEDVKFDFFNLSSIREEIKQKKKQELVRNFPIDLKIKSINDFVQSILSSMVLGDSYNWLICEGSSEKNYFNEYFSEEILNDRLKIVPVGGATEIKKIYNIFIANYEEIKNQINGKIFFLTDTDEQLVEWSTHVHEKVRCLRMVANDDAQKIVLVNIDSNPKSPATVIEDALDAELFFSVLNTYEKDYSELNFLKSHSEVLQGYSRYGLDLKRTEAQALHDFFNKPNIKFDFSKKYAELYRCSDKKNELEWITEVKLFFKKSQKQMKK